METQIALPDTFDLVPVGADKDARHRLTKFSRWMTTQGRGWHEPDLAVYRDHLLSRYAPSTVQTHLATIRGRYREILRDNGTREVLYRLVSQIEERPADRKALVDELLARIENGIDPQSATVKTKVRQDRPDSQHLRLTSEQASALMAAPGLTNLDGLRDTAVITVMLCTGIREAELSALSVQDLRQRLGGELALHVQDGKGRKERLIPYGELSWVLAVVDRWLAVAGIEEDHVFRGIYKGGQRLRPGRLSVRAIQYILASYPIMVDGELVTARPHDLRRTYARLLYEAGVDLVAIQQNLGHADVKTTLGYIGTLDAGRRRAPAIYSFDLARLFSQAEMNLSQEETDGNDDDDE
jgi:site-specific recombinase XerD